MPPCLIPLRTSNKREKLLFIMNFEGWDASLTTNHSILVRIRITFRIRECLPLRDREDSCKNLRVTWYIRLASDYHARGLSAASADVCGSRALIVISAKFHFRHILPSPVTVCHVPLFNNPVTRNRFSNIKSPHLHLPIQAPTLL